ncbi:MAG TPA: WGxxGxxG family protein [Nonomuraea sp.]|nr:WGxxGxxG family protein [Nonomuraea sp.]
MRKILTGLGLAFFLTLVPAAAATADAPVASVSTSQAAQPTPQDNTKDDGGNAGLWGLLGLLGLLGLAGMRKQHVRGEDRTMRR